jgi:hypothetical protein
VGPRGVQLCNSPSDTTPVKPFGLRAVAAMLPNIGTHTFVRSTYREKTSEMSPALFHSIQCGEIVMSFFIFKEAIGHRSMLAPVGSHDAVWPGRVQRPKRLP